MMDSEIKKPENYRVLRLSLKARDASIFLGIFALARPQHYHESIYGLQQF